MAKIHEEKKRKSIEGLRAIALEKGGSFDEVAYVNTATPISFTCAEGHEWRADPWRVLHGSWCQKCFNLFHAGKHRKLKDGLEQAHELAAARGGKCLSTEYVKSTRPLQWECNNGHEWSAALSDIKRGTWCPTCSSGYRERLCRHYFEAFTERQFPKIKPEWLINSLGNRMEIDGCSEELKLGFEHHGEQHYRQIGHFNRRDETLSRRIHDDETKEALCEANGVTLIVIPYSVSDADLPLHIFGEIKKQRPDLKLIPRSSIAKVAYVPSNELEELRSVARAMGGECLSNVYLGVFGNHRFRCSKGHEWEATPSNVKRGTWCPTCKPDRIGDSNRKHSVDSMMDLAAKRGGLFLSESFKSVNEKYTWRCSSGHEWKATPAGIMHGEWCKKCASEKQRDTIEELQRVAAERGGRCLSAEYVDQNTKLEFECANGHRFQLQPKNLKNRGSWCVECSRADRNEKTMDELRKLARSKGGELLSREYTSDAQGKLRWRCKRGHEFEARATVVKTVGSWCRECGYLDRARAERSPDR